MTWFGAAAMLCGRTLMSVALQVYPVKDWGGLFGLLEGMRTYPESLPLNTRWKYIASTVGGGYTDKQLRFAGERLQERYGPGERMLLPCSLE